MTIGRMLTQDAHDTDLAWPLVTDFLQRNV